MSRSRVVASQPARASAASSLSLAEAILLCLLVPVCLGLLACMSAPALVSVSHVFRRSCSALLRSGGSVRCGGIGVPEPDVQGEDTVGAVEMTRASPAVPPDSAGSRAAPTASAVPLSPRR